MPWKIANHLISTMSHSTTSTSAWQPRITAVQVPAALGLPSFDVVRTLQATANSLPLPFTTDGAFSKALGALTGAAVQGACASSGLKGPFAEWRRCGKADRRCLTVAVHLSVLLRASSGECRSEIDSIFRSGNTLQLQFPAEDLGFVYPSSALPVNHQDQQQGHSTGQHIELARTRIKQHRSGADRLSSKPDEPPLSRRESNVGFSPSMVVGGRMPHFELGLEEDSGADDPISAAGATTDGACATGSSHHQHPEPRHLMQNDASSATDASDTNLVVSSIDVPGMLPRMWVLFLLLDYQHWEQLRRASQGSPHPHEFVTSTTAGLLKDMFANTDGRAWAAWAVEAIAVLVHAEKHDCALPNGSSVSNGQSGTRVGSCELGSEPEGSRHVAQDSLRCQAQAERMRIDSERARHLFSQLPARQNWFGSDINGTFSSLVGGGECLVLVRPDGHIAAMSRLPVNRPEA